MRNLRNAMLVAVAAAAALAAITGYFALDGTPARLFLDGGLAVALVVIVWFMLSPTLARVDALVEALRALARGDKNQRVDPDTFAGLGDVARALNEVAAALTDGDDPNLGPIKSVPRPPRATSPRPHPAMEEVSNHPEVGAVRVIKKLDPRTVEVMNTAGLANAKTMPPTSAVTEPPKARTQPGAAGAAPVGNGASASNNDTAIDDAPPEVSEPTPSAPAKRASSEKPSKAKGGKSSSTPRSGVRASHLPDNGTSAEGEIAQLPTRAELETLFSEFVAAKSSHDETVSDLDFEAFASTIQGECERLVTAHQCRGVRFEVTVQDGEVSLRPRLLR